MKKVMTLALATVMGLGLTVLPLAEGTTTAATTAAATTVAETKAGATTAATTAKATTAAAKEDKKQVAKTGEVAAAVTGIGVLVTVAGAAVTVMKRR